MRIDNDAARTTLVWGTPPLASRVWLRETSTTRGVGYNDAAPTTRGVGYTDRAQKQKSQVRSSRRITIIMPRYSLVPSPRYIYPPPGTRLIVGKDARGNSQYLRTMPLAWRPSFFNSPSSRVVVKPPKIRRYRYRYREIMMILQMEELEYFD